jgi:hypothetical protein
VLDDIPGRKLTQSINSQLIEYKIPATPLELETIMVKTEYSELTAFTLDLSMGEIIERVKENLDVLTRTQELLGDYIHKTKLIQ